MSFQYTIEERCQMANEQVHKIMNYWNDEENYKGSVRHLRVWVERFARGRNVEFFVKSNMVNGYPPQEIAH